MSPSASSSGAVGGCGARKAVIVVDATPIIHIPCTCPNRHGNQTTFNLNTLLANNIYQCDYFRAL